LKLIEAQIVKEDVDPGGIGRIISRREEPAPDRPRDNEGQGVGKEIDVLKDPGASDLIIQ